MLSRVADSIFWMSRYVERAENVARFVDVNFHMILDGSTAAGGEWLPLVDTTGDHALFAEHYELPTRENVIRFLTFDAENPNSILSCVRTARENARTIRDTITSEMWEQMNSFYLMINDPLSQVRAEESPYDFFSDVRKASQSFVGITDLTLSHGEAWAFCRMGRLLERTDKTTRLLDVKYFLLKTAPRKIRAEQSQSQSQSGKGQSQSQSQSQSQHDAGENSDTPAPAPAPAPTTTPSPSSASGRKTQIFTANSQDSIQWAAVLKSASALEMFRKRYRKIVSENVVEYLLLDREFPRSASYCVDAADSCLHTITGMPRGAYCCAAEKQLGQLCAELSYAVVGDIIEPDLHVYLDKLQTKLNEIGVGLHDTFFSTQPEATKASGSIYFNR